MSRKKAEERLPWFPCEAGKLLSALQSMKPHVAHTYMVMLLRIYEVGGPNPDTLDVMVRRTGYSKRVVSDALNVLFISEKLVRVPEGVMNPYAESVLSEMGQRGQRLTARARSGARELWQKRKEKQRNGDAKSIPEASLKHAHLHLQDTESLPLTTFGGGCAPVPVKKKSSSVAKVPAGLIPQEWKPEDQGMVYAVEFGFDENQTRTMVTAFVDHHRMHKNKYDWDAAWRTWVRNERKFINERAERDRRHNGSGRGGRLSFSDIARGKTDEQRH